MKKPKKAQPKRQIPPTLWKKVLDFNNLKPKDKLALEKAQDIQEVTDKKKYFTWKERRKLKKNADECYVINMHYGNIPRE